MAPEAVPALVADQLARSRHTHLARCVNLNPATNVLHPSVAALLGDDAGMRPSLGHPGAKYETGLEALEELEVLAGDLAAELLGARHVDVRVPSGSIANLVAFRAACEPGDAVVVPPPALGGHATHHAAGGPGILGLEVHHAPVDADRHTIDVGALAELVDRVRPSVVSVGGSLNLLPHAVREVREVADHVGATVLHDAAHAIGMHTGGRWPSPLAQGAHIMTSSTYKSFGGPPGGLVATTDDDLARRVDAIVHPGLTANFDLGRTAALAVTLAWWLTDAGPAYAAAMAETAAALSSALDLAGAPVHHVVDDRGDRLATSSHHLALDVRHLGGGTAVAHRLAEANLLASAIGLPVAGDPLDTDSGLRLGTPELVRWGAGTAEAVELAGLVARALAHDPSRVAEDVTALRSRLVELHHVPTLPDVRTTPAPPAEATSSVDGVTTPPRPPPPPTETPGPRRRPWRTAALVAAGLLAAVSVVVLGISRDDDAGPSVTSDPSPTAPDADDGSVAPEAAYPGRPQPGRLLWGAATGGNTDPTARHETPAGTELALRRTFFQWDQRSGELLRTVEEDVVAGRLPWVSVKTPGWASVAAGGHDAQLDGLLAALDALDEPVWLTVHHEPEGGNGVNAPDDPAGPEGHVAMNRRVRARMDELGTTNIALVPILMSYTWTDESGRDPDAWFEPGIYDLLGVDHYAARETSLVDETWLEIRAWAAERDLDVAVGEWGLRGSDDRAGRRVVEWYEHAAGSADDGRGARVVALAAFDSGLNSPRGGWELAGGQLDAFQRLMTDPRTARPAASGAPNGDR